MKITFLGTSHGVPSKTRFCSSAMIESGNGLYLIDAGAPSLELLLRHDKKIPDLRAVFTTHVHMDHTSGLLHLAGIMNWYYKTSRADFFLTDKNFLEATKRWIVAAGAGEIDEERLHFRLAGVGEVYADENIRVEYIPTAHMPNSYAILVSEGDTRVLFGGDFSYDLRKADVPKITEEEIDAFVCELAHFDIPLLTPYLEKCRAKNVLFVHAKEKHYGGIEEIRGKYPFEILTPADGDTFEI